MFRTPGRIRSWADDQRLSGNSKLKSLFFFACQNAKLGYRANFWVSWAEKLPGRRQLGKIFTKVGQFLPGQ